MGGYRAKKRLGQHFLKSPVVIARLVELIDPRPDERIIEIGPGRGALTAAMAPSGAKITAVEFDSDLSRYLSGAMSRYPNVEIINRDFLSYEPDETAFKLVGNIPYNITSPVVEWIVTHRESITRAYLMLQREMAERLTSSAGSKGWSPIAIFTQLHFNLRRCFDIPARDFSPPPKVVSSAVEIERKDSIAIAHPGEFEKLVRTSFRHRRKTLINNLVPDLVPDRELALMLMAELSLSERIRAEQVTTAQFLELTKLLVSRNIF